MPAPILPTNFSELKFAISTEIDGDGGLKLLTQLAARWGPAVPASNHIMSPALVRDRDVKPRFGAAFKAGVTHHELTSRHITGMRYRACGIT
jgi:hypothetical protein